MVSAMAKLMSQELGAIYTQESASEQAQLKEVARFRKNELGQAEVRYQKALRPAREEAMGIIQGAARVYLAKCDLAQAIRATYIKEWDEENECFWYKNRVLATKRRERPIIMGPYDVRALDMTREQEEACKQRSFARYESGVGAGDRGAVGGSDPPAASGNGNGNGHGNRHGSGSEKASKYGSSAAAFRPPPASAGQ